MAVPSPASNAGSACSSVKKNYPRRFSGPSRLSLKPRAACSRTPCPKDHDAFSYDPAHLQAWHMPQDLWVRLPHHLLSSLAALQHAGAAVLTGFERLEGMKSSLHSLTGEDDDDDQQVTADYKSTTPSRHDSIYSTSSRSRSSSTQGSVFDPPEYRPTTPLNLTPLNTLEKPASPYPYAFPSYPPSPAHTFIVPLDPHSAYYAAELLVLKSEALPRLRHVARRVDAEWGESLRMDLIPGTAKDEFAEWWDWKKGIVKILDERSRELKKPAAAR